MNTQLLCTFCDRSTLEQTVENIKATYTLVYNIIYVLSSAKNKDELFITYNIDLSEHTGKHLPSTILIHRKKETNTLYTINALNSIIKSYNNGFLDKTYVLDWTKYRNSIILTTVDGHNIVTTRVLKVIKI